MYLIENNKSTTTFEFKIKVSNQKEKRKENRGENKKKNKIVRILGQPPPIWPTPLFPPPPHATNPIPFPAPCLIESLLRGTSATVPSRT
jgi:hypothetical protein